MQIKFGDIYRVTHTGKKSKQHVEDAFENWLQQRVDDNKANPDYKFIVHRMAYDQNNNIFLFVDGEDLRDFSTEIVYQTKAHAYLDSSTVRPIHEAASDTLRAPNVGIFENRAVQEFVVKAQVLDFEV